MGRKRALVDGRLRGRTFTTGTGQVLHNVHRREDCADSEACVIHRPSNHRMRDFRTHWRWDRRIMERICTHGVGHPDPDCAYAQAQGGVHGCCGCCGAAE